MENERKAAVPGTVGAVVGRDLIRWDDCPLGKDLQPGCGICQRCEHFGGKEWECNGGAGCYITRCNAPNDKAQFREERA